MADVVEPAGVVVIERAIGQGVDDALEAEDVLVVPTGIVVATQLGQLIVGRAEM